MSGLTLISRLIPPILETVWVRIESKVLRRIYRSKASYDNKDLARIVANKTLTYKMSSEQRNLDSEESAVFLSALWFLNLFGTKEDYRILDYGGGGGIHYFAHHERVNQIIKEWLVVETPSMVEACRGLEDDRLRFLNFHDLKANNLNIDLIYSSCALQYTEAPEETLSHLLSMKAKVICFSRIVLTENHDSVSVLEISKLGGNGPQLSRSKIFEKNICYNSTAIPLDLFESRLKELYSIQFRIKNGPTRAYKAA